MWIRAAVQALYTCDPKPFFSSRLPFGLTLSCSSTLTHPRGGFYLEVELSWGKFWHKVHLLHNQLEFFLTLWSDWSSTSDSYSKRFTFYFLISATYYTGYMQQTWLFCFFYSANIKYMITILYDEFICMHSVHAYLLFGPCWLYSCLLVLFCGFLFSRYDVCEKQKHNLTKIKIFLNKEKYHYVQMFFFKAAVNMPWPFK